MRSNIRDRGTDIVAVLPESMIVGRRFNEEIRRALASPRILRSTEASASPADFIFHH